MSLQLFQAATACSGGWGPPEMRAVGAGAEAGGAQACNECHLAR